MEATFLGHATVYLETSETKIPPSGEFLVGFANGDRSFMSGGAANHTGWFVRQARL